MCRPLWLRAFNCGRPDLIAASLLLTALFSPFCPAQGSAASPLQNGGEKVHYGDIVDVDVVGSLEFDWRGGLTPEGFLDGPERLDKPVFALCRYEEEVGAAVREAYRSILRDPKVVVRIVDRSNRALAYVDGAVRKPQRFQLRRPVSLSELIVLSGGITDSSSGEISVFRPPNVNCLERNSDKASFENAATRSPKRFTVKIADLLAGKADANMAVLTGDVVTVIEAPPIFVTGGVLVPRRMNLTPELTLSRAVSAAGGAIKAFGGQRARIFRRGASGILEYDLRKASDGGGDDPKLEPFDVVEIEQRGVEPRRVAPMPDPPDRTASSRARLPLRIVD